MDRNGRLARVLEAETGVSGRRLARWPRDLLPPDLPKGPIDPAWRPSPKIIAHLGELDGLIGTGRANANVSDVLAYNDLVALVLAARGHGCERLRLVFQTITRTLLEVVSYVNTTEDDDERFKRLEELADGLAATLALESVPNWVQPVKQIVRNIEENSSKQHLPAGDQVHSFMTSIAAEGFGDGLYNTEVLLSCFKPNVDPDNLPTADDSGLLLNNGMGLRFDWGKLSALIADAPLNILVEAAQAEVSVTRLSYQLITGRHSTDFEIDALAALTGIMTLGLDSKSLAPLAAKVNEEAMTLDSQTQAQLMSPALRAALTNDETTI